MYVTQDHDNILLRINRCELWDKTMGVIIKEVIDKISDRIFDELGR